MIPALTTITRFASAGGGGSGGGGDGGGGAIVLFGYLPTHLLGAYLRRKMHNPMGLALMVIGTLVYGGLWWLFGFVGVIVSLAAFLGGPAGYFGWFGKVSSRIRKKAKQEITVAASQDPAWQEAVLDERVKTVFMSFQKDWSNFNTANFAGYLTPGYSHHVGLMLEALKQRGRQNIVESPQLLEAYPTEVDDEAGQSQDKVTFFMHAKSHDRLVETVDGQSRELFDNDNDFYEFWHFERSSSTWLLDDISQYTEDKNMKRNDVQAFAAANSLYYSLDWGWLLLPSRGQLFGKGKFGKSDINNHVIGMLNNTLIELYTYVPATANNDVNSAQFVIAQMALPKRYDSLVVEAKSGFASRFRKTPKGYNKVTLEWPDFNKRYFVFATNVEQVTAFELLNPKYMEQLFDLPFKVSIEVVDNVVYLYTKDKKADYNLMYTILKAAYEEMKL